MPNLAELSEALEPVLSHEVVLRDPARDLVISQLFGERFVVQGGQRYYDLEAKLKLPEKQFFPHLRSFVRNDHGRVLVYLGEESPVEIRLIGRQWWRFASTFERRDTKTCV